MELSFTKMHGLGNDFVVIDGYTRPVVLDREQIRFLADRHLGVGCDQVLLVEPPESDEVDFRYRIFNQDGGEVEQCGNGVRCFARFVVEKGLTDKTEIAVETAAGVVYPRFAGDGQVVVDMGAPRFEPAQIPFEAAAVADRYPLLLDDAGQTVTLDVGVVSMGNPHAVLKVDDVDTAPVARWGALIEAHSLFPARVNAGFMQIVGRDAIKLRVFERGVGETRACGTGACAAMVVARRWGMVEDEVTVSLPGGDLRIRWAGEGASVEMTGPAQTVFEGSIRL